MLLTIYVVLSLYLIFFAFFLNSSYVLFECSSVTILTSLLLPHFLCSLRSFSIALYFLFYSGLFRTSSEFPPIILFDLHSPDCRAPCFCGFNFILFHNLMLISVAPCTSWYLCETITLFVDTIVMLVDSGV